MEWNIPCWDIYVHMNNTIKSRYRSTLRFEGEIIEEQIWTRNEQGLVYTLSRNEQIWAEMSKYVSKMSKYEQCEQIWIKASERVKPCCPTTFWHNCCSRCFYWQQVNYLLVKTCSRTCSQECDGNSGLFILCYLPIVSSVKLNVSSCSRRALRVKACFGPRF
jgi:hypothetical protein